MDHPEPDWKTQPASSEARRTFPIRTVAALTGVSAFSLRAWERRHGLITPQRTANGQRLYSQADVDRIRRILALLDAGMAIGQVAGVIDDAPEPGAAPPVEDFWSRQGDRMAGAIAAFDERSLENAYQEALALHPMEQVTERLLLPLLRRVGQRWLSSECGIAEEHFFSVYLRNKLGARFHHRRIIESGPLLLCACLPGERHEVGQLLFALAAHERGFRCVLLGADVPPSAVEAAAARVKADAVTLSASVEPPETFWTEDLPRLVKAVAAPVFVGGPLCLAHRGHILEAGAHELGSHLNLSFQRIHEAMPRT
jgi:DNA-binding transcriptional MerR regulator